MDQDADGTCDRYWVPFNHVSMGGLRARVTPELASSFTGLTVASDVKHRMLCGPDDLGCMASGGTNKQPITSEVLT